MIVCDSCDKPATVHLTEIDAASGRKKESHLCLDHAERAGFAGLKKKVADSQKVMQSLVTFVKAHRRVPSLDEWQDLGAVGVLLPADQTSEEFSEQLARLEQMAKMILADDSST